MALLPAIRAAPPSMAGGPRAVGPHQLRQEREALATAMIRMTQGSQRGSRPGAGFDPSAVGGLPGLGTVERALELMRPGSSQSGGPMRAGLLGAHSGVEAEVLRQRTAQLLGPSLVTGGWLAEAAVGSSGWRGVMEQDFEAASSAHAVAVVEALQGGGVGSSGRTGAGRAVHPGPAAAATYGGVGSAMGAAGGDEAARESAGFHAMRDYELLVMNGGRLAPMLAAAPTYALPPPVADARDGNDAGGPWGTGAPHDGAGDPAVPRMHLKLRGPYIGPGAPAGPGPGAGPGWTELEGFTQRLGGSAGGTQGVVSLWAAVARNDCPATLRFLIGGADPDEPSPATGEPPLLVAARLGHAEALMMLLEAGAGTEGRDRQGRTALHWAARRGDLAMAGCLLVDWGAVALPRDRYGDTPVHVAAERGHSDFMQLLLRHCRQAVLMHVVSVPFV